MHRTLEKLLENGPVLLDGAWGTQLQVRGLEAGECPDAWNITKADKVKEVAEAYVDAGSDIILTNTFGGNRLNLASHGLGDKAAEVCKRGAEISKSAAQDKSYVFGSVGPTGKMVMMGETSIDELLSVFGEQAQALADGGADGIVVETMSDLDEAKTAVEAGKTTGLPVVACMVYDSGPDECNTMMGTTPEEAAAALMEKGADIIGSNCGRGIESFVPITKRLSTASGNPVWIKPNAGMPELVDGENVYSMDSDTFAKHVPALIENGAKLIGGCCGSTPEFIKAVRKVI